MVDIRGQSVARPPMPDTSDVFSDRPKEARWARDVVRMSQDALAARTPDLTARPYLLLLDPDGVTWQVSVTTGGSLAVAPAPKQPI